jgi:hypothetical protein
MLLPIAAYQDHLEVIEIVYGGAKHRTADRVLDKIKRELELGGNVQVVQFAGDGVPHHDLERADDGEEPEAVAPSEGKGPVAVPGL